VFEEAIASKGIPRRVFKGEMLRRRRAKHTRPVKGWEDKLRNGRKITEVAKY